MNSLNILSGISSTPPPSPARSRAGSETDFFGPLVQSKRDGSGDNAHRGEGEPLDEKGTAEAEAGVDDQGVNWDVAADEKTALLGNAEHEGIGGAQGSSRWWIPKRLATAFVNSLWIVCATVVVPGRYLVACFYDEEGGFSILAPLYRIGRTVTRKRRKEVLNASGAGVGRDPSDRADERKSGRRLSKKPSNISREKTKRSPSVSSTTSSNSVAMTSDSESERPPSRDNEDSPVRNTRSKTVVEEEEIAPARRSIRIKLHNEDSLRHRKTRQSRSDSIASKPSDSLSPQEFAAAAIKSPTSPASSKLKFPRAPAPPRPLVPRRQASYAPPAVSSSLGPHAKTLILDLDETLIHSMAKGGRYTTGHMVEVKLNTPVNASGAVLGSQVPILYYVHKRPHCDEFLRKVSKWYNLIIFTASVQEYADPVIDWLELERKYFAGRYYRQHCTFRNGAYIKDLAQVEPDLSRVMIVDNSPMSYIFHEDNAIPIEGWISDPTDNDLLHLIPLLEGLQYVTDLRALLALRLGEPAAS